MSKITQYRIVFIYIIYLTQNIVYEYSHYVTSVKNRNQHNYLKHYCVIHDVQFIISDWDNL